MRYHSNKIWVKAGRISIGIVFTGRVNGSSMEEFMKVNMMRNKEKISERNLS